jgi:hypothetical protein
MEEQMSVPEIQKGKKRKQVCVSITDEQWLYMRQQGGSKWLRELIVEAIKSKEAKQ